MMAQTPHAKRMTIARSSLLLDQPFFGMLALNLELVEDATQPTAYTNGEVLGYSPAFIDTLSDDELQCLIAHEVMHCACGHPWRRDKRDATKWNVACDYAINGVLVEAGFKLPADGLIDQQTFGGKWSEWIYDRLPDAPASSGGSSDAARPGSSLGDVRDAPAGSKDDSSKDAPMSEADWQQATRSATAAAASRGHLPQSMQQQINEATQSRVDWRSLLRRYVQEVARADYSWSRPSRRYLAAGMFLPSLHSEACGRIAVAVDTSGSIDTVLLGQFAAEIRAIADELQPSSVEVLYCDARVHRVDVFERGDYIDMHAIGRGGTSFAPVFARIDKDGDIPAVLIYLTDLDGAMPTKAPEYPVIWAVYGRGSHSAPFGDVVPCA